MSMICIYMISSKVNPSRVYIGSAVNFKGRMAVHITHLKNGEHHARKLQRHVNKYGIDDLRFEVITRVDSKENLLYAEQRFINMFNPYFNSNPTAGSNMGAKFGPMKQVHKDKIAEGNKGKKVSQEFIDSHSVKVYKYNLDGKLAHTYKSKVAAMQAEGVHIKISNTVNLTISGYVWVSENSEMPDFNALKKRLIDCRKVLCKKVLQIDKSGKLVAEFEGVRIACKITGIDHRSISQVASGSTIRKTAGGFLWKYKTEGGSDVS